MVEHIIVESGHFAVELFSQFGEPLRVQEAHQVNLKGGSIDVTDHLDDLVFGSCQAHHVVDDEHYAYFSGSFNRFHEISMYRGVSFGLPITVTHS